MNEPHVLLIAAREDDLTNILKKTLDTFNIPVYWVLPSQLDNLTLTIREDKLVVENKSIHGMFVRIRHDSIRSPTFDVVDRSFVNTELTSVLLASINLPSVKSINMYESQTWFADSEWDTWRGRFIEADLPVSVMTFSNYERDSNSHWQLFQSTNQRSLPSEEFQALVGIAYTNLTPVTRYQFVLGKCLMNSSNKTPSSSVFKAAEMMQTGGIKLCEIVTDGYDHILHVDTLPLFDTQVAGVACKSIAETYVKHLRSW